MAEFDPSQPFETQDAGAEFDPSQPFESADAPKPTAARAAPLDIGDAANNLANGFTFGAMPALSALGAGAVDTAMDDRPLEGDGVLAKTKALLARYNAAASKAYPGEAARYQRSADKTGSFGWQLLGGAAGGGLVSPVSAATSLASATGGVSKAMLPYLMRGAGIADAGIGGALAAHNTGGDAAHGGEVGAGVASAIGLAPMAARAAVKAALKTIGAGVQLPQKLAEPVYEAIGSSLPNQLRNGAKLTGPASPRTEVLQNIVRVGDLGDEGAAAYNAAAGGLGDDILQKPAAAAMAEDPQAVSSAVKTALAKKGIVPPEGASVDGVVADAVAEAGPGASVGDVMRLIVKHDPANVAKRVVTSRRAYDGLVANQAPEWNQGADLLASLRARQEAGELNRGFGPASAENPMAFDLGKFDAPGYAPPASSVENVRAGVTPGDVPKSPRGLGKEMATMTNDEILAHLGLNREPAPQTSGFTRDPAQDLPPFQVDESRVPQVTKIEGMPSDTVPDAKPPVDPNGGQRGFLDIGTLLGMDRQPKPPAAPSTPQQAAERLKNIYAGQQATGNIAAVAGGGLGLGNMYAMAAGGTIGKKLPEGLAQLGAAGRLASHAADGINVTASLMSPGKLQMMAQMPGVLGSGAQWVLSAGGPEAIAARAWVLAQQPEARKAMQAQDPSSGL